MTIKLPPLPEPVEGMLNLTDALKQAAQQALLDCLPKVGEPEARFTMVETKDLRAAFSAPSQQHPASPHRKETNMMHKSGRNDTQNPGANVPYSSQKTLADYIALKQESDNFFEKKKLTFEEWWQANCSHGFWVHSSQECPGYRDALRIWKAAQENV